MNSFHFDASSKASSRRARNGRPRAPPNRGANRPSIDLWNFWQAGSYGRHSVPLCRASFAASSILETSNILRTSESRQIEHFQTHPVCRIDRSLARFLRFSSHVGTIASQRWSTFASCSPVAFSADSSTCIFNIANRPVLFSFSSLTADATFMFHVGRQIEKTAVFDEDTKRKHVHSACQSS